MAVRNVKVVSPQPRRKLCDVFYNTITPQETTVRFSQVTLVSSNHGGYIFRNKAVLKSVVNMNPIDF